MVNSKISTPKFKLLTFNFQLPTPKHKLPNLLLLFCIFFLFQLSTSNSQLLYAQEAKSPIVVNGDTVEYSADQKQITAAGNVVVIYKGAKLTCDKLTVNTQTKDAQAQGNVKLEDERGIIKGEKVIYNFQNKTGLIINANFQANPYFGRATEIKKVSDNEFVAYGGYATTCSYDRPHFKIKSKKIDFYPQDKVRIGGNAFYLGDVPLVYLPQYQHNFKEPFMHVRLTPGVKKDWGPYMLTAWRYVLTDNISGRIYLDYRNKLGLAEGFGANYKSQNFGRGDFKYYYTHEEPKRQEANQPSEFQRYFIRWRHKWDIDERTNVTSEYYKIVDSKRMLLGSDYNVLKDYFPREYEKDSQPLSYILGHHSFIHSSIDAIIQKRTNRWYEQLEKLPEVKYALPSLRLGDTPFYFENNTQAANFNYKYAVPSPSTSDINVTRFDMFNKFSLPMRAAFLNLTPFVGARETFYDKDINNASVSPRSIFYTGMDASTKFYRIFNVKSNILGLDINGLRHIITPTLSYAYNHKPSVSSRDLKQIDALDSIDTTNTVAIELSNKLQTKRKGNTVDLADLRITTGYDFYRVDPQTGNKSGGNLSDFLLDLELLPYAWMRIDADATYKPQGDYFSEVNYDINFIFAKERSIGIGQRYQRKGGKELTFNTDWRLNPKWKLAVYERYEFTGNEERRRGLKEQQYTVSRDLHCWTMDFAYNIKQDEGHTIWFIFRLKAFPEAQFDFNQSYHAPKSGTQS